MHECMYMFSHILSYFLYYLQKSIPSFKKIWPLPEGPEKTRDGLPLKSSCVLPLQTLDAHWRSVARPNTRLQQAPEAPRLARFTPL